MTCNKLTVDRPTPLNACNAISWCLFKNIHNKHCQHTHLASTLVSFHRHLCSTKSKQKDCELSIIFIVYL